jgi:O-antigen ligase
VSGVRGWLSRPILILGWIGYSAFLAMAMLVFHLSPETLLALIAGGVALVLLILSPLLGVHVLVMMLFFEYATKEVEGLTIMKVLGFVILVGWLLSLAINRSSRLKYDPLLAVMGLFVVWCGCTSIRALNQEIALSRLVSFLSLFFMAMMVGSVVDSREKMRGVYLALVFWTTLITIEAVVEYYIGMTRVAQGLLRDRNLLANYVNLAVVTTYFLHQTTRHKVVKFLLASALPVLFLGLFLTLSRAGLVVLGMSLIVVWYRIARERRFSILLGSLVFLCLISFILPDSFWRRAGTILPELERQEDTFGLRVFLWKTGARMVEDHPIMGVGAGNFVVAFPNYVQGRVVRRELIAHNSYVSVAAEMGLIGLAIFLAIHILALRNIHRGVRVARSSGDKQLEVLSVTTEVCLIILMTGALAGSGEGMKSLWIVFGLSASIGHLARAKTLELQRETSRRGEDAVLPPLGSLGVAAGVPR